MTKLLRSSANGPTRPVAVTKFCLTRSSASTSANRVSWIDDLQRLWEKWRSRAASPPQYGKGADLLAIENVPLVSRHHCGSYFTADTLRGIDRIKRLRSAIAQDRSIAVAVFP